MVSLQHRYTIIEVPALPDEWLINPPKRLDYATTMGEEISEE